MFTSCFEGPHELCQTLTNEPLKGLWQSNSTERGTGIEQDQPRKFTYKMKKLLGHRV